MKSLLLLCCAFLCLAGLSRAATLSGTVFNAGTGLAVSGQKVYVLDSLTNFSDSTLTNSSGAYSFSLTGHVDTNNVVLVYTRGCGKTVSQFHLYSGGNIAANLYICPALYSLNGTVSLNGAFNNGPARLFLISKYYNVVSHDTVMSVLDTIFTDATGGTFSKAYSVIPGGALLLKAELLPSHPAYGNYFPVWFGGALLWSNAQPLSANNFSVATATNISLAPTSQMSGTALLRGEVVEGAHKNSGAGDPLEGRLLLLTNAAGVPLSFATSDSSGEFNFSDLAFGTYKLFGDAWGKLNPALTFTLTAARPAIIDIIFEEDSTSFRGSFSNPTGVGNGAAGHGVQAFPNPASGQVTVSGLREIGGSKSLELRSMTGAVLMRIPVPDAAQMQISLAPLPAGIYMLELKSAAGVARFKVQKL